MVSPPSMRTARRRSAPGPRCSTGAAERRRMRSDTTTQKNNTIRSFIGPSELFPAVDQQRHRAVVHQRHASGLNSPVSTVRPAFLSSRTTSS
jgi:hypothetical protein